MTSPTRHALNAPDGSVLSEIFLSFFRLQGLILGLVGAGTGTIVWFAAPTATVRVGWLWIVVIVSAVIIWLLIDTCRRLHQRPVQFLPRVATALPNNGLSNLPILILEPSELFGQGSLVTVFYVDQNAIELQVGSGQVSTIQLDKKVQVEVTHWAAAHQDVLDRMKAASVDILQRLLVKPTITSALMDNVAFLRIDQPDEDDQLKGPADD